MWIRMWICMGRRRWSGRLGVVGREFTELFDACIYQCSVRVSMTVLVASSNFVLCEGPPFAIAPGGIASPASSFDSRAAMSEGR